MFLFLSSILIRIRVCENVNRNLVLRGGCVWVDVVMAQDGEKVADFIIELVNFVLFYVELSYEGDACNGRGTVKTGFIG